MSDTLEATIADERAEAIRLLLGQPLLTIESEPDGIRAVVRHGAWLIDWFEDTLGWRLVVDAVAGFARLSKRSSQPDPTRMLHRSRGDGRAFDRRRYQLLCLVCAGLARHPVTTIGLLADNLRADAALDTALKRERAALVDALRMLAEWGVLTHRGGDLDSYVDSAENNAILTANTHRLHHLLSSATAPGRLDPDLDPIAAIEALIEEPRYGDAADDPDSVAENQRLRWTRHMCARIAFDDPVLHFDETRESLVSYLHNGSGRGWIRARAQEAGFDLEERSEGLLAADPSATATDVRFPSPLGTVGQVALLLTDELIAEESGERRLTTLTRADLQRFISDLLRHHQKWAKTYREGDGPNKLVDDAVQLLASFGLVAVDDDDGRVAARPALARYRVATPDDIQLRLV